MNKQNNKIPYVKEVALEMEIQKMLICSVLHITEAEYCRLQFETGCWFVEQLLQTPWPQDTVAIKRSALFWGWWKTQWHQRDIHFYEVFGDLPPHEARLDYRFNHRTDLLSDQPLKDHFWHLIDRMLIDGENRILNEEKGLVHA